MIRATTPLARRIGASLPVGELLPLAIQLADALAAIHGRGHIHGDLRPASILVDEAGELVLPDDRAPSRATTVLLESALPYMAPEQTGQMNRPIDGRSDLYALGVVLYQLLAGRLPFEAADAIGWAHAHVARQPRPLEQLRPALPRPLIDLVHRLLAKLPDHRYQSAAGLRHDLQRCLREWTARGAIAPFPLGERDISDELRIPQRLYGRDAESAALHEAFERVAASGAPELVLLSGYAGIGKSAVVRELRPFVRRRGRFIAGKFEQYKRDIPYLTISQALGALALDLLAEGEAGLVRWRPRLAQALGSGGKLIVDLVPQLGLIVGPQPPVPELPLTESETRLRWLFGRLFAACATPEHPLAMFVDDLQWADSASLGLLAHLMTDGEARHLLIVGAYRDNEVDPTHPLARMLEPVRRSGARVRDLVLGSLAEDDLVQLVADTVRAAPAEAAPLAALVREKTGGNPFFAIQFLTALYHKRAIWFDHDAARWRWDVTRIRAEGFTDNLAELMRGRLYALPAATQAALQLAACLGGTVDAAVFALAADYNLGPALRPALEQHLLLELVQADRRTYRFPHDRVHEAAYALLPEPERARTHLELGRRLLAGTPPADLPERLFEIVSQLDRAITLGAAIDAPAERERIAELLLTAGTRAQASTAHASALRYLTAGATLLAAEPTARPALAFALELRRAECELLTGAADAAEPRLAALALRAGSLVDLAAVTAVLIELYVARGRFDLALEAARGCLRRAGIEVPAHPTDDDVRREYDRIWQQLGDRPIEALADLPPMTDPDHRATLDVLTAALPIALLTYDNLHALLVCQAVSFSLEHGTSDASCMAYATFGRVVRPRFHDGAAAYRFAMVGFALLERRAAPRWQARVYVELCHAILPWTKHVREVLELSRRAFDVAKETGDLTFAAYASSGPLTLLWLAGAPLPDCEREAEGALAFLHKLRFDMVIGLVEMRLQLIRALQGKTRALGSFTDDSFDESALERRLVENPSMFTALYWTYKVQHRFLAGDHAGAAAAADSAQPLLGSMPAFAELGEHALYAALAFAAYHGSAPAAERPELLAKVAAYHAQLEGWAKECPSNFVAPAALASAELARLRGKAGRAVRRYEQAIRAAREHGFVQTEAVAYEVAARFHRGRGETLIADAYLREAHDRYLRWGAEGKARQLRDAHPALGLGDHGRGGEAVLRLEQIDRLSVIKASQTISGVMDQDLLSRTLLRFVLEEGGARRVALALAQGDTFELAAEASIEGVPAPAGDVRVPWSLLAYVQHTGEPVLLDASSDAGRFAGDPYFADVHPCSALCLPVRVRAESIALLYLENDLVPGAFTPERLAALELLAAQAAISLENARLLERERARRRGAEVAELRQHLLGAVTALMSQALEHGDLSAVLTRLCADSFVDWAVLDLVEQGAMVSRAAAHRDPAREPLLRELIERYPPRPGATTLGWELPAGELPELPVLGEDQLRVHCTDERHADLVHKLGARSAILVPLYVRDAAIGVLSLASPLPPARLTRDELDLAAELGRRMALALDNARLLAETRRALHQREEFLRIASHELRTPLASLRLSAQALLRAAERKRAVPPEIVDQTLRRMLGNTMRLEQLTSELLDLTRIEEGRLVLNLADVALDAIVRQSVEQLEPDLTAAGTPVSIECAAPVYGQWDPTRLDQVITNLVVNASKYGAGKPIQIRIERAGDTARLAVIDRGIGIDPARRPFIFDRFERAVSSTSFKGLGLGLYIARSIVVAHGGSIAVESEPGVGSTFTVDLPCAPPQQSSVGRYLYKSV